MKLVYLQFIETQTNLQLGTNPFETTKKRRRRRRDKMFPTSSSVSTDPVIAALPRSALLPAFSAVVWVVGVLSTDPIAAELPIVAFLAALPTVVPVTEDVPAVCLAAVEEARPVVRRNPVADVVSLRIAASTFLYDAEQEPAPGSEAGRPGRVIEDIELVFFVKFSGGS